jgi:hypothetical protein
MLTQEDDIDIHALRRRGWSISAIARHVGRDRKTIRYADIGGWGCLANHGWPRL